MKTILIFILAVFLIGAVGCGGDPPPRPDTRYEPPVLTTTTAPDQYYELPHFTWIGITPPPGPARDLYNILLQMRYGSNWTSLYTGGEFDCSEMSGFLEFMLEEAGFDTYILVAELTGRDWYMALEGELQRLIGMSKDGKMYHAWLVIRIGDEFLAIEATIPSIDTYYGSYKYQEIYSSVEEAEKAWPGEFDYWNSSQFQNLRAL